MKNTAIKILTVVLLLLGLLTCRKDPEPTIDQFELTKENLTVGTTTVNIVAAYDYSGKIEGIKVCVSEDGVHPEEFEAEINGKNFTVEITGLRPATSYQYYYSIDYGFSKPFTTESKTFTTLSESPTVRTIEVISIDSTNVRVNCETVSAGGLEITERGICWNTFGNPNLDDDTIHYHHSGLGSYSCVLRNLEYNTTYYVRAYARNATGIGFGDVLEFRTGTEVTMPQVSTVEVSGITANGAVCKGNVSSNGGTALSECGVCWGTNPNPSLSNHHQAADGVTMGVFTVTISGLNPNSTYYVRCYATNTLGTAYGEELSFTTTEGLPTVTTSGITNITATSATGGGDVTDEGESNVTERGICWNTSHNPSISDNHAYSGTGPGSYTVNMAGLTPNATYYVRAYAKNQQGIAYGAEVSFTALEGLPEVTTQDVSDITATSAKGHGTVTDQGGSAVTERGVCWGIEPSPTIANSHANSGTGEGSFTVNITSLAPGTKYYVRAYAINTQGTTYGDQKEFTTGANLPTVTTSTPIDVTQTTATGRGEVTDDGGATVTERGVCWSTDHNPTTSGSHTSSGTGTGAFTAGISGLNPGTTYYVRAYATNSEGTSYGNEVSMATTADQPTVTTGAVSNITQTTALGSGNVTGDGGAAVTERGVCWSTSHNPTTNGNHASNGSGMGGYTVNMAGLTANTTYYVRAYATNNQGTSYGNEVSFTTAATVSAPTVTTGQVINIAQTSATGAGEVTADGGATVTERGVCWSTSHNPTTSGSHASSGTGTGTFTASMTGLTANTTYYVRAYAINSQGTSYGNEVSFATSQVPSYTIAVSANPTAGGTVAGGGNYQQNQSCTVTATPATGYSFLRWTEGGNQVSTNANYIFTVTGNRTLVAQFQLQSYTITASANPTAGGTVTGGGSFNYGQSCTLTATANTGYTFLRWTENGTQVSTNANYTFAVSGNRTLVAQFQTNGYTINASANPEEGGTITGTGAYNYGQSCTLTATANTGYTFLRWTESGEQVSTNAAYTFTVSGNRTLVAQFQIQSYTISASAHPVEGGTVSGAGAYNFGQSCTLTANASSDYDFVNWTENGSPVSTNASYSFSVTGNRTLVANFEESYPIGAINGLFSVSATQQVYFSQGNLQYIGSASTPYYKFADNQYDRFGDANMNSSDNDLLSTQLNYNWSDIEVENGGNQAGIWHLLSSSEWLYLARDRNTSSGIKSTLATVNGVPGLLLPPDDWEVTIYPLIVNLSSPESNVITMEDWNSILEPSGMVFLPCAGIIASFYGVWGFHWANIGYYWAANAYNSSNQYTIMFNDTNSNVHTSNDHIGCRLSVRLVQNYCRKD